MTIAYDGEVGEELESVVVVERVSSDESVDERGERGIGGVRVVDELRSDRS